MPWIRVHGTEAGIIALASASSSLITNHISGGLSLLPVRPMRWRNDDTVHGASIWNALSRRPMSIPSSSVDVVHTVRFLESSFISLSADSLRDGEMFP